MARKFEMTQVKNVVRKIIKSLILFGIVWLNINILKESSKRIYYCFSIVRTFVFIDHKIFGISAFVLLGT